MKRFVIMAALAFAVILASCSGRREPSSEKELQEVKKLVTEKIQKLRNKNDQYTWGSASLSVDVSNNSVSVKVCANPRLSKALQKEFRRHPEVVIEDEPLQTVPSEKIIASPEESGIEAELISYNSRTQKIAFSYKNTASSDREYGSIAALEIRKDDGWYTMEPVSNAVTLEGYTLRPGEIKEFSGVVKLYGVLPKGHYRFVREFTEGFGRNTVYNAAFEFDQE